MLAQQRFLRIWPGACAGIPPPPGPGDVPAARCAEGGCGTCGRALDSVHPLAFAPRRRFTGVRSESVHAGTQPAVAAGSAAGDRRSAREERTAPPPPRSCRACMSRARASRRVLHPSAGPPAAILSNRHRNGSGTRGISAACARPGRADQRLGVGVGRCWCCWSDGRIPHRPPAGHPVHGAEVRALAGAGKAREKDGQGDISHSRPS